MITRIPEVSNRETWTDTLEFLDDEDGSPWFTESDQDSWPSEITLSLRDDFGVIVLSGSLTGGQIEIVADGIAEFTFSATAMSALCAEAYDVGCLYTGDVTKQVILGRLSLLKGL